MFGLGVDQRVADFRAVAVFAVADDVEYRPQQGLFIVYDDVSDSLEINRVDIVFHEDDIRVLCDLHGVEVQAEADRACDLVPLLIVGVEDDPSRLAVPATPFQFTHGDGSFHVLIDLQMLLPPYSR